MPASLTVGATLGAAPKAQVDSEHFFSRLFLQCKRLFGYLNQIENRR